MPHKRAKRGTREQDRKKLGVDNVPTKQTADHEAVSKRLTWVLNAEKVRKEYREKRKRAEESGDEPAKKKKKLDGSKLTIMHGESMPQFHKRVETDMRSGVRTAMQKAHKKSSQIPKPGHESNSKATTDKTTSKSASSEKVTSRPPRTTKTEYDALPKSTRVNDIAMAPPTFKTLPRNALKIQQARQDRGGGKASAVPLVQREMMEKERLAAIARYRQLKEKRREQESVAKPGSERREEHDSG